MGTTLESNSGLDQDKTLACRTLGTPPRHAWKTVPPQQRPRRPLELPGRRRDLRKTKGDAQDDCHTHHAMPHSVLPTVLKRCTPRFTEETTNFSPMHVLHSSL